MPAIIYAPETLIYVVITWRLKGNMPLIPAYYPPKSYHDGFMVA